MEINVTTPALLFPAISLLLLAYTNRFLALGSLIRSLHGEYKKSGDSATKTQLTSLRRRVYLIRNMQGLGVGSLFLCVLCMFVLFTGGIWWGQLIFGASLLMLLASLGLSIREIQISVDALNVQLGDLQGESTTRESPSV